MKIYISADFEGVAGIVDRHQCFPGSSDFEISRRNWIKEINAVVEGALTAGGTEFVVNEAHALMNYMIPEVLHPKASFISGYVKPDNQMEGIDPSFKGAVILGHAMAGTSGAVLNHAYVMRDVVDMRLNGERIGEFGLNAYWAAYYGVPTILVVGDDKFEAEAKALIPKIEVAVVKRGISQFTAHNLPLEFVMLLQRLCHGLMRYHPQILPTISILRSIFPSLRSPICAHSSPVSSGLEGVLCGSLLMIFGK
jgi:D-amino peptidase